MMILTRKPVTREQYVKMWMDRLGYSRIDAEEITDVHIAWDQINLIPEENEAGLT